MHILGVIHSPYVMRAVLVARAKGREVELVAPPGGIKSPEYLAINPVGKVPCLIDGDLVLPESAVIADYFEETLPGPRLLSDEPNARVRTRLVCRFVDTLLSPGLSAFFQSFQKPDRLPEALELIGKGCGAIEHFRRAQDPWAAGEDFSHADAALMPMLYVLDYFDAMAGTGKVFAEFPGLGAYWERARNSAAGSRMTQEMKAGFDAVMTKAPA